MSSLVTQYRYFTFKQTIAAVEGRKRKELKREEKKKVEEEEEEEEEGRHQVANGDRESERKKESPMWDKMFLQLCGGSGGVAHQQSFWLFNFSTAVYK